MTNPIPSQSQIDAARDQLERAQLKLGKCQTRAILSGAQAKSDKAAMDIATRDRDAAQEAFEAMVDRFTLTDDIATAKAAIRATLQPEAAAVAAQGAVFTKSIESGIANSTEIPAADGAEAIATLAAIKADDYVPPRAFGTFQGGTVQAVLLIRGVWQMQVDGEWFECPPPSQTAIGGDWNYTLPMVGDFVPHHSNFAIATAFAESDARKNVETTDNVHPSTDPVLSGAVSRLFAGN